jgi:hypothetical protein
MKYEKDWKKENEIEDMFNDWIQHPVGRQSSETSSNLQTLDADRAGANVDTAASCCIEITPYCMIYGVSVLNCSHFRP